MRKKFQVGCPCCCECTTWYDLFTQGGRVPLPVADYTERVPTPPATGWSFVPSFGYITPDASGNMFTYNRSKKPANMLRIHWRQGNTADLKIVQNWLDANNHAYLLCEPTSISLLTATVHKVVAGVDTTVAGPTTLNSSTVGHLIWVGYCKNYLQAIARVASPFGGFISGNVGDSGGKYCGLEAVDTAFEMDEFDFASCISTCGINGWARMAYDVEITNDDYYQTVETHRVTVGGSPGDIPTVYSTIIDGSWTIYLSFDVTAKLLRVYTQFDPKGFREFRISITCQDLTALSNFNVPWYSGIQPGSTCKITAVV